MGSPAPVTVQLGQILATVDRLWDMEGQDRDLLIEMSQAMLADVAEGRGLRPIAGYVRHYCDVTGSAAEADRIAAAI